jgi:peptidoglycan hydrolase FlgJ
MSALPPTTRAASSAPSIPALTTAASAGAPVARPSLPADPAKLWKTARDFEAMALGEFLKPMFETADAKNTLFSGGDAEKTWKPMLVDEIAKQISAAGGLGLAGSIHDAMLRMQEGKS